MVIPAPLKYAIDAADDATSLLLLLETLLLEKFLFEVLSVSGICSRESSIISKAWTSETEVSRIHALMAMNAHDDFKHEA